ncbi:hypothetical protein [Sphingobium sp. YG1]|uniref:hypothetical protein n=1 Tax=Sphingobium sp. YG1 TaxID=2082188 RepID=UPI000E718A26|nr:hypothetical protein [Sphingobium sp. YG1]
MIANDVLVRRTEVVRIHLNILEGLLLESPSVSSAIRASISLRFLMEGALSRLAGEMGARLLVPTPNLAGVPLTQALVFACGGYAIAGAAFAPYYAYRKPGENSPHRPQYEREVTASPEVHNFIDIKFGAFQNSICLAILGRTFTRGTVVRYVANKCGGAHHHDDTAGFDEIEHGITNAGHSLELNANGLSAVFMETIGTANFLLTAPDIIKLRSDIATLETNATECSRVDGA